MRQPKLLAFLAQKLRRHRDEMRMESDRVESRGRVREDRVWPTQPDGGRAARAILGPQPRGGCLDQGFDVRMTQTDSKDRELYLVCRQRELGL